VDNPPSAGKAGRNLPVAIASGLALAAVFLGTLVTNPWLLLGFIGILMGIAMFELDHAFRGHGLRPLTPVAVGAGFVMFFGTYRSGASAQTLGLVLLLFGAMAGGVLERDRSRLAQSLGATMLMAVWVPFLASFMGLLLGRPNGRWYVFAAVLLAVMNDIGAFAVGMRFGRHKMAPKVSPAKSWEGFAGGVAAAMLAGVVILSPFVPGLGWAQGLLLGAGAAVAATLGDLAESMVKRDLGMKDLGRIIPGHGGIMDRADAIIFALPMVSLLLDVLRLP
jgi:phosphatidate cytidylyltransferase